jgi:hypothetical protein
LPIANPPRFNPQRESHIFADQDIRVRLIARPSRLDRRE